MPLRRGGVLLAGLIAAAGLATTGCQLPGGRTTLLGNAEWTKPFPSRALGGMARGQRTVARSRPQARKPWTVAKVSAPPAATQEPPAGEPVASAPEEGRVVIATTRKSPLRAVGGETGPELAPDHPLSRAPGDLGAGEQVPSHLPARLAPIPQGMPVTIASAGPDHAPAGGPGMEPEGDRPEELPVPRREGPAPGMVYPSEVAMHPTYPGGPPVPREFHKRALSTYIVEPPDVLLLQGSKNIGLDLQPISGQHLVRPDGTVGLGIYGAVFVAGRTLDEVRTVIAELLHAGPNKNLTVAQIRQELDVDVIAYNSKHYYVITDGAGYGEQVYRVAITGNETVLDALSQIYGLPAVASKKEIWVARATPGGQHPMILPVDWEGITRRGSAATNYQLFPGDRIYVNSQKVLRVDSVLAKFLSPIERVLGTTLLGATTVNAIRGRNTNPGGFGGF
jgi:protein involved in polysaccharide export with SLBB domain